MSHTFTLYNVQQGHKVLLDAWQMLKAMLSAGHRMQVVVRKEKRTNEQNRLMWAALHDIANQVTWHGVKLSAEDWKHLITASLKKQRIVPGIDGGFVALGQSTSEMDKAEMSEVLECALAFGAGQGVVFHDQR